MPKATLANLDQLAEAGRARRAGFKHLLMVCAGTGCVSADSLNIRDALTAFEEYFRKEVLREVDDDGTEA